MEISPWVLVEMLPSQLHKAQGKVHFIIPQTGALVVCYCHYPRALKSSVLFIGKWKFWLRVLFVFRRAVLQSCICLCLSLSRKLLCEGSCCLLMTPIWDVLFFNLSSDGFNICLLWPVFLDNVYHMHLGFRFKTMLQSQMCQFCMNG